MTEPAANEQSSNLDSEEMLCLLMDYLLAMRHQYPDRLRTVLCEVFEYLNEEAKEEGEGDGNQEEAVEEGREREEEEEILEPKDADEEDAKKKAALEEEVRAFFEGGSVATRPEIKTPEQRSEILRKLVRGGSVAKPSVEPQSAPVAKPAPRNAKQARILALAYPNVQGRTIGVGEPSLPTLRKNLNIGNPDKMLGSVKSASKTCMACRGGL